MSDKKEVVLSGRSLTVAAAIFLVSAFFASLRLDNAGVWGALFISIVVTAAVFAALWLFRRELSTYAVLAALLAVLARLFFFDVETSDYTDFLQPWIEYLRQNGGLAALNSDFSNYNIPYLVFLALFSYTQFSGLYLIKLLSVVFELALACSLLKLAGLFTVSRLRKSLCFAFSLVLPTVFINGSVWGQCDSIYVCFAVLSLYLCLSDHPILSMAAIALSFAFKLQAIFIMPVYLLFIFAGKLKWRHLTVFPLVYLIAVSPAIIAGRGIAETVLLYLNNASTVGDALNYNAPSMYSLYYFYRLPDADSAAKAGIIAAFLLCFIVFVVFFIRRRSINNRSLLFAAVLFCVGIPLLLPHMHDRYFYLCDVLLPVVACAVPMLSVTAVLSQFASLLGYYAYFFRRFFIPMRWGFAAMLLITLSVLYFTLESLINNKLES